MVSNIVFIVHDMNTMYEIYTSYSWYEQVVLLCEQSVFSSEHRVLLNEQGVHVVALMNTPLTITS